MSGHSILGDRITREVELHELLGASDDSGLSASFGIAALAELAKRGIQTYNQSEAQKQSAADVEAKSQAIIALDRQATSADAQATYAAWIAKNSAALAQVNPAVAQQAQADQAALAAAQQGAQQARSAEDGGAVGLSPEVQAKRVKAASDDAQRAVAASVTAAQAAAKAPSDVVKRNDAQLKAALATAAQATAAKAASSAVSSAPTVNQPPAPSVHGGSFLTKMHAGVPTWGWIVGGGGAAVGLVLLIRHFLRGRKS